MELKLINLEILCELTSSLTVMLVEDDPEALASYTTTFKRLFKEVHPFENGKLAYEYYNKNHNLIDMVVSDITMPKMDGIELCENIRDINPDQKILILSAHNDTEKLFKLINLGVDGFIVKPPSFEQLNQTLFKLAQLIHDKKDLADAQRKLAFNYRIMARQIEERAFLFNHYHKTSSQDINNAENNENTDTKKSTSVLAMPALKDHISLTPPQSSTLAENTEYLSDDVVEMREIIDDIDYLVIKLCGTGTFDIENKHDIEKLGKFYAKYSFILKSYPSFAFLSEKLFELSCVFRKLLSPESLDADTLIGEFLECMTQSLLQFQKQVIEDHTLDRNFFDASLANDIDTIVGISEGKSHQTTDDNDVIEFF